MHVQRKHHSSGSDSDDEVAAAKAFLKQHLQQQHGAAGAEDPPSKKRKKDSKKHSKRSKHSGSASESESDGGDGHRLPSGVQAIKSDDYFVKSAEFTAWLLEKKGVYFNGEAGGRVFEISLCFQATWVVLKCVLVDMGRLEGG